MNDTLQAALDACRAAIRYDDSIAGRAIRGEMSLLADGTGVASGDDLDALYDDWIRKAKHALAVHAMGKAATDA